MQLYKIIECSDIYYRDTRTFTAEQQDISNCMLGSFLHGYNSSEGLTNMFKNACSLLGIQNAYGRGKKDLTTETAWNKVYVDNQWYNVNLELGKDKFESGILVSDRDMSRAGSISVYSTQEHCDKSEPIKNVRKILDVDFDFLYDYYNFTQSSIGKRALLFSNPIQMIKKEFSKLKTDKKKALPESVPETPATTAPSKGESQLDSMKLSPEELEAYKRRVIEKQSQSSHRDSTIKKDVRDDEGR